MKPARVLIYVALVAVTALYILPLFVMVSISLKTAPELAQEYPTLLPERLVKPSAETAHLLDAYGAALRSDTFDYLLFARNTVIIAVLSLAGVLISCSIAAYGFARVPFRGRKALFGICLATMMIPFPVIMVPSYILFKQFGWIGTFLPLWVPAWFGSAFNIFLLRQFFMGVPKELEEAAMLDGCSRWGCFWRIMLPLAKPALAVVTLFHVLFVWNDLVGPLMYLSHRDQFTLALGLQFLQTKAGDTPWNELMAATTLIVAPVIVLFLFAQRTFIKGIATTGLKG